MDEPERDATRRREAEAVESAVTESGDARRGPVADAPLVVGGPTQADVVDPPAESDEAQDEAAHGSPGSGR